MSQENVEIVRRGFEAWNRNDWDTLMAVFAPDVVAIAPAEWPEPEIGTGREALRDQFERLESPWEEQRIEVDDIRDLGDRVLVLFRWIARGIGSHVEVEHPAAVLDTLRDGSVVRVEFFFEDQSRALEAAGLRE